MSKLAQSLVSVVISSYESADTLPRAIRSALIQTWENLEVVVVDNGSYDNTSKIVKDLMLHDSRIHLVRLDENQRPAGGRNAGVTASSGEFVAFLDADDEWHPQKITEQIGVLVRYPEIGIVITDSYNINSLTGKTETYSSQYRGLLERMKPVRLVENLPLFEFTGPVRQILYEKCIVNLSSVFMRKDLFLTANGFNPSFYGPEDMDLWVRLAKYSNFAYLDSPVVNRYYSTDNISMRGEKWLLDLLKYHKHCYQSDDYKDLRRITIHNLEKYYRYLVITYGQLGKNHEARKTCIESTRFGFFPKVIGYTIFSFLGWKKFYRIIKFKQDNLIR